MQEKKINMNWHLGWHGVVGPKDLIPCWVLHRLTRWMQREHVCSGESKTSYK